MAVYAREQAVCHFSPALIRNLEANWHAHEPPSDVERAPRERLRALQLERLRATVARLLDAVPLARDRLHAAGVRSAETSPASTTCAGCRSPTRTTCASTTRFGLLAVPRERARAHPRLQRHAAASRPSSATRAHDLDVWSEVMARCMAMAGVRPGMVVHNAYGYGLFTGGLGFHQGAERLGATVVPVSGGVTDAPGACCCATCGGQVLCCTPSYALHIAQALARARHRPDELALEVGMFGAEPWTEAMRDAARAASSG